MGRTIEAINSSIQTISNGSSGGGSTSTTLDDGNFAAPSLKFTNDIQNGIYKPSNGVFGVATDGAQRIGISSSLIDCRSILSIPSGSASVPGLSFGSTDSDSGFYRIGPNNIGLTVNGVKQIDISTTQVSFTNALSLLNSGFLSSFLPSTLTANRTINLPDLSGTIVLDSAIQTLTNKTITLPVGSDTLPSLNFLGDTTTGLYNLSAGVLGITTSGAYRMNISSTSIDCRSPIYLPGGSASVPALTFGVNTTLGIYRIGANNLGICCNSIKQVDISSTGCTFTNLVSLSNSGFSSSFQPTTLTANRTLILPDLSGTLALVSQIPSAASFVDLSTNQTVAGIKTFISAPVISSITNTGTLTLPTATGTLALVSQIPTNSSYVDVNTNQSVAGAKTFLSGCSITAIGSSTPSSSALYINAGSTAIGGVSNYFFTYLDAAITIPTAFTGIASTFTIANAPTNTTGGTGYALNILAGNANFGGSIINSVGAVATPSYTFAGDLTSGLYRIGASNIGISCGGVKQIDISTANNTFTNKITLPNGTTATPSLVFSGGATSGIFYGSSSLKFATSGVEKLAMSSTLTTFASNQIVIPVGSFTVPSISFLGDTTTGLYSLSAGLVNMTCSGALMLQLSSTALDLKALQFTTGAGSATIPSHSFGTDTSTGLYRVAASTIGLTCGGTKQLDLSATAAQFTAPVFSSNQPYFQVGGGGAQSIANATDTVLTSTFWSGGTVSVGSGISYSAGVFTVTNTGTYCINASGTWTGSNTTGQRVMYIFVNNVSAIMLSSAPASADIGYNSISMVYRATAGDTFRIRVFQSSGGAVNFSSGATQAFIINRFA